MRAKDDKRTKSIYFSKDVWEKVKQLKNPSRFINTLLRNHYDSNSSEVVSSADELQSKIKEQNLIIEEFLSAYNPKNDYFDYKKGATISREILNRRKGV